MCKHILYDEQTPSLSHAKVIIIFGKIIFQRYFFFKTRQGMVKVTTSNIMSNHRSPS